MDWNDPSLYDLIINTEIMGIDSAVKLLADAASAEAIQACSMTAIDAMERLSQKKKIEAVLVENDINLFLLHVDVPETGVARISGTVYSDLERNRVTELVESVSDVSEVRSEIGILPASY